MPRPLRLLIIEDSADDYELLVLELLRGGFDPVTKCVESGQAMTAALAEGPWDVVLSDYSLPCFDAIAALRILQQSGLDIPFIVISGTIGEELAVGMMRSGASDYILKHNLGRLGPAITRELRQAEDRQARREAERAARQLADIVQSANEAILSKTLDGIITSWNPAAERLYGWSAKEAIGSPISMIVPSDHAEELADILLRLRRNEPPKPFETIRLHKDGRRIEVSVTISPLRDGRGQLIGAVTLAHDITARKRMQEGIARDALLLENVRDSVIVTDVEGRVTYWNEGATRLFGWTAQEMLGQICSERFPAGAGGKSAEISESVTSGIDWAGEFEDQRKDGSRVWIAARVVRLTDSAGQAVGFMALSHDISDRKRAELEKQLLISVVETSPNFVAIVDEKRRLIFLNQAGQEMLGLRGLEQVQQTFVGDCFSPAERERLLREPAIQQGRPWTGEFTFQHFQTGALIPVRGTYFNLPQTSTESPAYFACVATDISQEKLSEQDLRDSEERFRAFMDNSSALAWISDAEGRMVYLSGTYKRTMLLPPGNLVGRSVFDLFPRDIAQSFMDKVRSVARTGEVLQAIGSGVRADGMRREFLESMFTLPTPSGETLIGGVAVDVTEQRRTQDALLLRDRAIQAVTQGILITDSGQPDNLIIYASPSFTRLTGYTADESLGRNSRFLQGKDTDPTAVARIREAVRSGRSCMVELLNYRKDGTPFWNELSISSIMDPSGKLTHSIGVQTDVTQRRLMEDQYRQAQRMEAVGQLAGGVAHDFNNLLTIINGYSALLLQNLQPDDPAREFVREIKKAGERSAGLTRQLLTFSRQQLIAPKVINLNEVVTDLEKMLYRIIGEDIQFSMVLARDLGLVNADAGQIEQVLMNLAVNARDAMPKGGILAVETRNIVLDASYARMHLEVSPGPYVLMAIRDTGCGMASDVRAKIFEPFFTTKEVGKGTGLGLAVVHGIVRQSGGHIEVESKVGIGTTFKVYLPRVSQPAQTRKPRSGQSLSPRGSETILLVEDDEAVRSLTNRILVECGYTVIGSSSPSESLRLAKNYQRPIHLLLTDVVMPGLGGRQVAEQLLLLHPEAKVLYLSGYTDDAIVRQGILHDQVNFLEKPFAPLGLSLKVREVLDGNGQAKPASVSHVGNL